MKTKNLLSVIAVVVLSATAGYAQRVEATLVDGHPVINCESMPASAVTTTPKGNTREMLQTPQANEKVYKRFCVYNSDNHESIVWSSIFTLCSGISGGEWRPPTQRELMLMWVLKPELERISAFKPFVSRHYWSATVESSNTRGWNIKFDIGYMSTVITTNPCVRCVKELP